MIRLRSRKGAFIAEGVATMSVILPILVAVLFVAIEASYAYVINSSLSEAAREAARNMAIEYGKNPAIADSRSLQDSQVYDHVRIDKIVADSSQFENGVFDLAADPPIVTVAVHYASGQHGLPVFPTIDPLHIADTMVIIGRASYRLSGL